MASRLFYLGFTGKSYIIALVDTTRMPSVRVPVKDCPMLPDLPFVNCDVVNVIPKLKSMTRWDGICRGNSWYVLGILASSQDIHNSNANSYMCIIKGRC